MRTYHKKGFTLIELLVVISIISLLATLVVTQLGSARLKARDAKRVSDIGQMRKALSLYYDSTNSYPPVSCGVECNAYYFSNDLGSDGQQWSAFAVFMKPYLPILPVDPTNNGNSGSGPWWGNYTYTYGNPRPSVQAYDLDTALEDPNSVLRCGVTNLKNAYGNSWCTAFGGSYSNQMYGVNN